MFERFRDFVGWHSLANILKITLFLQTVDQDESIQHGRIYVILVVHFPKLISVGGANCAEVTRSRGGKPRETLR